MDNLRNKMQSNLCPQLEAILEINQAEKQFWLCDIFSD